MPRNKRVKKDSKNQAKVIEHPEEIASTELQTEEKGGSFDQPLAAEVHERFQLPPDQFIESQNQSEELKAQQRERMVYADSVECAVGYNSLIRLLGHYFVKRVAYYRSKEGGSLPLDEARTRAYRQCKDEEQANALFDQLMSKPVD
jgi:hypothetical protein